MKKYNEGYALPFVLVVMVVICLVGISILSSSLNNLQNQKASIERMQDRYEAEGKIEKVMAMIKGNGCVSTDIVESCGVDVVESFEYKTESNVSTLVFGLEASNADKTTKIICKVQITGTINGKPDPSNLEKVIEPYTIVTDEAVMDPIYDYLSYEIVNVTEVE